MKLKRDYEKILQECLNIDPYFFVDVIVSLYGLQEVRQDFQEFFREPINQDNLYQALLEISKNIMSQHYGFEKFLEKVIKRNNNYIQLAGYNTFTQEQLSQIFSEDIVPSIHRRGITPEMMILYYFSNNMFKHKDIEFLIEQHSIYKEKAEQARQRYAEQNPMPEKLPSQIDMEAFLYAQEDLQYIENADWQGIAERFGCEYDEENKVYNKVKRGYLLYYDVNIEMLKEIKNDYEHYFELLFALQNRLFLFKEKQYVIAKEIHKLKEENRTLRIENKRLKKTLTELEHKLRAFAKTKDDSKEKEYLKILKENYYLKTRIEKLEQTIEDLEKAEEINKEIQENITIEKPAIEIPPKQLPEYQTIAIVGGKWNSREKELLQEKLNTCEVIFIEPERTIAKIDAISNADIVVFDTSRNAHKYHEIVKQNVRKLFYINKSSAEEVIRLFQQNNNID